MRMNYGMLYMIIGYCTGNEVVSIERTTSAPTLTLDD
jgi:hypothetical protein